MELLAHPSQALKAPLVGYGHVSGLDRLAHGVHRRLPDGHVDQGELRALPAHEVPLVQSPGCEDSGCN